MRWELGEIASRSESRSRAQFFRAIPGEWTRSPQTAIRDINPLDVPIPRTVELAPKIVEVGNCSGRDVQKFEKFGLTPAPAERVAPPLVAECFANLECKVADTRLVNKYNLFVLEVLKAWTDPAQKDPKTIHHRGCGRVAVDGEMIKLKSKMP